MRSAWRQFRGLAGRRIKRLSEKTDALPVQPAAGGGNGPDERPPRKPEPPAEDDALPSSYEETRVVLLPVDPYLVYVYWELGPKEWEHAKKRLQEARPARPVLRFHEITNAHAAFDVEIDLSIGNWYVHLWSPEKSYCADLGLKEEGGRFVSLARSNLAHTPRAGPSVRVEEHCVVVEAAPQTEKPAAPRGSPEPHLKPLDSIAPVAAEKRRPAADHAPKRVGAAEETQLVRSETPVPIDYAEILRRKLAQLYAVRKWPPSREPAALTARQPLSSEASDYLDLAERNEASMTLGCSSGPAMRHEGET